MNSDWDADMNLCWVRLINGVEIFVFVKRAKMAEEERREKKKKKRERWVEQQRGEEREEERKRNFLFFLKKKVKCRILGE